MKKILTLALAFSCGAALAQKADNVGIGTSKPDPSAILDLNSNTKGLLLPRMSEAQRNAIKNPAAGLIIFQTDQVVGTYTFDGTAWQPSNARTSATSTTGAWDLRGSSVDGIDFLGTTNAQPLRFKVNDSHAGSINSTGLVTLGIGAGQNNSAAYNIAMGAYSLFANTSGLGNVAIGYDVMSATTTGNSGNNNVGIGISALQNNRGTENVAIGRNSLTNNTLGSYNVAIGGSAGLKNTTGNYNFAFGNGALTENQSGSDNVAIGPDALRNNTGSRNVGIGTWSGRQATGSDNVFIGYSAGTSETGSNMLYIANTGTINPLMKGNFSSNWIRINSKTTGYMAIGDFDTAASGTPGIGGVPIPANAGQANGYRLIVQDGILCEKLKVALRSTGGDWADYVFEPSYKLMPLEEVERYTKDNKHLPNVPSADEMVQGGLDVSKTSKMFMEKIEELTLYVIELDKQLKALKKENELLKK